LYALGVVAHSDAVVLRPWRCHWPRAVSDGAVRKQVRVPVEVDSVEVPTHRAEVYPKQAIVDLHGSGLVELTRVVGERLYIDNAHNETRGKAPVKPTRKFTNTRSPTIQE
jgi:hypothetical protein